LIFPKQYVVCCTLLFESIFLERNEKKGISCLLKAVNDFV